LFCDFRDYVKECWFKVSYDEKVYYNSIPVSCSKKLYVDSTIDVTDEEMESP